MDKRKIIYYRDELNDEFSKAQITPTRIDGKYVYCHDGVLKKCASFFLYRLVFFPIAYAYSKFCFGHKLVGKEKLDEIIQMLLDSMVVINADDFFIWRGIK